MDQVGPPNELMNVYRIEYINWVHYDYQPGVLIAQKCNRSRKLYGFIVQVLSLRWREYRMIFCWDLLYIMTFFQCVFVPNAGIGEQKLQEPLHCEECIINLRMYYHWKRRVTLTSYSKIRWIRLLSVVCIKTLFFKLWKNVITRQLQLKKICIQ